MCCSTMDFVELGIFRKILQIRMFRHSLLGVKFLLKSVYAPFVHCATLISEQQAWGMYSTFAVIRMFESMNSQHFAKKCYKGNGRTMLQFKAWIIG